MTTTSTRARFTKLSKAAREARQAATDFAFTNRPLSPAQVEEWHGHVAKADAAQDAVDAFYRENCAAVGGALRC